MNILLANAPEECASWKKVVVIVDVLRTVSTVCSLLMRGPSRAVLVCGRKKQAEFLKQAHPGFAVFSENKLPFDHQDDSPFLAQKLSTGKEAVVVSADTGLALQGVPKASKILLGGFCNFEELADVISAQNEDVLMVPASIFGMVRAEEDILCASAFKDYMQHVGTPERALGEFGNTVRLAEFRKKGPKTAEKDLKFVLKINGLPMVPQVIPSENGEWGLCVPYGKEFNEIWLSPTLGNPALEKKSAEKPEPKPAPVPVEPEEIVIKAVARPEEAPADNKPAAADKSSAAEKTSAASETKPEKQASPAAAPAPEEDLPPVQVQVRPADELKKEDTPSAKPQPKPEKKAAEEKKKKAPEKEPKKTEKSSFQLKGFFSEIVRSVKEEKEELEQSLRQAALGKKRAYNLKSQDPMDALLNRTPAIAPAKRMEGHAFAGKAESPVVVPAQQAQPVSAVGGRGHKRAIVLFSGGLDSTTCLYWAIAQGYRCEALTVLYGQRHARELESARQITGRMGITHHIVELNLPWLKTSSLVDATQPLPDVEVAKIPQNGIPSTYVPARNLLFLAMAASLADSIGADAIVSGPNAVDFSGYPDCTPAFYQAAGDAINRGTRRGVKGGIEVLAPLMTKSKAEIIKMAVKLHAPLELTWSCYAGGDKPCGKCDSCKLRAKGFAEAGEKDPAL